MYDYEPNNHWKTEPRKFVGEGRIVRAEGGLIATVIYGAVLYRALYLFASDKEKAAVWSQF
jgi:hypothetical protein